MTINRTVIALLAIILLAAGLRFYRITGIPAGVYPDAAMYGNNAAEVAATGDYKVFYRENYGREGLFINLVALVMRVSGNTASWILYVVSAAIGLFTVPGVYFAGRALYSRNIGLVAAFLMGTSFWHVCASRLGLRAIAGPLFLVWGIVLLLWAFESVARSRALWLATGAGIIYGIGFYTYLSYRLTPVLMAVVLFTAWRRARKGPAMGTCVQVCAVFLLACAFTVLPLGVYFLRHPADFVTRTSQVFIVHHAPAAMDWIKSYVKLSYLVITGDWTWLFNGFPKPDIPRLLLPAGVLFWMGAVRLWRMRSAQSLIVASWLVAGLLPSMLAAGGLPQALRSLLMTPAVCITAAAGGAWLVQMARARLSRRTVEALVAVCLLAIAAQCIHAYFWRWAQSPETTAALRRDCVELGERLRELPASVPKYVTFRRPWAVVEGIQWPAFTVMFTSDTYRTAARQARNVHYILPSEVGAVPVGSMVFTLP